MFTVRHERLPRPFAVLAVSLVCVGASVLTVSWASSPLRGSAAMILLVSAAVLSENFALSIPGYSVSLAFPLTMSTIVLCGPTAAGIVAASAAVNYSDIRRRLSPSVIGFNLGQLVLSAVASGWVYIWAGGKVLVEPNGTMRALGSSSFPWILVPLVACAVTCAILNMTLTSVGFSVKSRKSVRLVSGVLLALLPTQVALAFVGFLIAQVMAISLVGLPLFTFPLIIARQVFQRYTELRDAYVRTVRSLVGALEAKDTYTAGHSERVAEYAVALGTGIGLDDLSIERLEYAALLHDLGKLSLPSAVLSKAGRLSDSEFAAMRAHPEAGAAMVGRIPLLKDLAGPVRQHHEWYGGGGYPEGLRGDEIAQVARILSVADAYDAMTTDRSYRPAMAHGEALSQLVKGAGTQFDAHMVGVFIDCGIGKFGTEPPHESLESIVDVLPAESPV